MLLKRLGLSTVEVARLALDDLYWRTGEIEIDGKGHQRARLPLPSDVGEALVVAYLRLRGRHDTRRVFLTEHAPTRASRPPGATTTCSAGLPWAPLPIRASHSGSFRRHCDRHWGVLAADVGSSLTREEKRSRRPPNSDARGRAVSDVADMAQVMC